MTQHGLRRPKCFTRIGMPWKIPVFRRPYDLIKRKVVTLVVPTTKPHMLAIFAHRHFNKDASVAIQKFAGRQREIKNCSAVQSIHCKSQYLVGGLGAKSKNDELRLPIRMEISYLYAKEGSSPSADIFIHCQPYLAILAITLRSESSSPIIRTIYVPK